MSGSAFAQKDVVTKRKDAISNLLDVLNSGVNELNSERYLKDYTKGNLGSVASAVGEFKGIGGWHTITYEYYTNDKFKKLWDTYFKRETKYLISRPANIKGNKPLVIIQKPKEKIKKVASVVMEGYESYFEPLFAIIDILANPKVREQVLNAMGDWAGERTWYSFPFMAAWEVAQIAVSPVESLWYQTFGESEEEKAVFGGDPNPMNMIAYSKGSTMRNFDIFLTALFIAGIGGTTLAAKEGKIFAKVGKGAKFAFTKGKNLESRIDAVVNHLRQVMITKGINNPLARDALAAYAKNTLTQYAKGKFLTTRWHLFRAGIAMDLSEQSGKNLMQRIQKLGAKLGKSNVIGITDPEVKVMRYAQALGLTEDELTNAVSSMRVIRRGVTDTEEVVETTAEQAARTISVAAKELETSMHDLKDQIAALTKANKELSGMLKGDADAKEISNLSAQIQSNEVYIAALEKRLGGKINQIARKVKQGAKDAVLEELEGKELKSFYDYLSTVRSSKDFIQYKKDLKRINAELADLESRVKAAGKEVTSKEYLTEYTALIMDKESLGFEYLKLATIPSSIPVDVIRIYTGMALLPEKGFRKMYKFLTKEIPGFEDLMWPLYSWYALRAAGYSVSNVGITAIPVKIQQGLEQDVGLTATIRDLVIKPDRKSKPTPDAEPSLYKITLNAGFRRADQNKEEAKLIHYVKKDKDKEGLGKIELKKGAGLISFSINVNDLYDEEAILEILKDKLDTEALMQVQDGFLKEQVAEIQRVGSIYSSSFNLLDGWWAEKKRIFFDAFNGDANKLVLFRIKLDEFVTGFTNQYLKFNLPKENFEAYFKLYFNYMVSENEEPLEQLTEFASTERLKANKKTFQATITFIQKSRTGTKIKIRSKPKKDEGALVQVGAVEVSDETKKILGGSTPTWGAMVAGFLNKDIDSETAYKLKSKIDIILGRYNIIPAGEKPDNNSIVIEKYIQYLQGDSANEIPEELEFFFKYNPDNKKLLKDDHATFRGLL